MRLARLLVLDWHDGPVEAIAEGSDGESYLVRRRSELPIGSDAVYELRRLRPEAYHEARAAAEATYGPGSTPGWIIPGHRDADPTAVAHLDAVLRLATRPVNQRFGTFTGHIEDDVLVVDWRAY